jgi:hypothetical protein
VQWCAPVVPPTGVQNQPGQQSKILSQKSETERERERHREREREKQRERNRERETERI